MKRLKSLTPRSLDRIQDRFERARLKIGRRGSVLIIVIGFLVLLAIIGTAYISTARVDRGAAATNAENTEATILLQGVQDMAISQIIADINPAASTGSVTKYRTATMGYTPYNSGFNDQWLSDRVPTLLDPTQNFSASNPAIWHYISLPPTNLFSDPTTGATYGSNSPSPATTALNGTRCDYQPTWKSYTYIANGQSTTLQLPALTYFRTDNGTWSPTAYVAADTDGDGVADAGLVRLPCGEINGVTYYGAYRIVDNAAAINASVAWMPQALNNPQSTSTTPPSVPGNLYPTNVDLNNLICSGDSLINLNTYRFGSGPGTTPSAGSGYAYDTVYDAAWHELGRRLEYPGSGYQALSVADMATMAHRFVIRDANAAPSLLDSYLSATVYNNAPTSAYLPAGSAQYQNMINAWFDTNFNYAIGNQGATAGYANSLRSLLVTRNGVSNFTASKYGPNATATSNATTTTLPGAQWSTAPISYPMYTFGDWVTENNHAYVCIQPNTPTTGNAPSTAPIAGSNYASDNAWWVYEPWSNAPVKTNVNTATFGQLWLAYWNVMCEPTAGQNAVFNSTIAASQQQVGAQIFRSSLRYGTGAPGSGGSITTPFSGTQELQLRSAIAAVNTIDLRNTTLGYSNNVNQVPTIEGGPGSTLYTTPLPIMSYITPGAPAPEYTATIYGNKPQPYIAAVYANNDPTLVNSNLGYVAIELYNPYPYPITLTGWGLVYIPRAATAGATLNPQPISGTVTGATNWQSAPPTIPANGFCVLANGNTPAGFTTPPTATVGSTTDPLYIVPGLEAALGNDLVLMRPTAASASSGGNSNFTWQYAAPIDSYDFTGLNTQPTFAAGLNGAGCYEWTYFRDTTLPWHCVYPGPFNPALGQDGLHPRFLGTKTPLSVANAGAPTTTNISFLGAQHANDAGYVPGSPYVSMPIQLNNVDFGGPIKLTNSNNYFPFGGFARNADIMEVPYIGAYKIFDSTGTNLLEMNPVTLDATYAAWTATAPQDTTVAAVAQQDIGRFSPWEGVDYFIGNMTGTGQPGGFKCQLLDYLTVQSPNDDYAADTDPVQYQSVTQGPYPAGIANSRSSIVNAYATQSLTEDTVPVQGLININTAPWRVLAALPFSDDANTNAAVAQAIVNFRDGYWSITNGKYTGAQAPFKNLFDLNLAGGPFNATQTNIASPASASFLETLGSYNNAGNYVNAFFPGSAAPSHAPTNNDGMITPNYATATANGWPTTSGVTNDFQSWNLALARVSNLITTRSDSYTVYVTVQGWTNAGKANAQMVVQRRAAFIVDRSSATPANPTPTITNIPTN